MFYFLYETKNNINGKIYRGIHSTDDLDDGYLGSGKAITRAIKRYGPENFTRTILEWFDSIEQSYQREKEVVTPEFVARHDTYNLMEGGWGGKITAESNKKKKKTMAERKVSQGKNNSQYGTMWITDGNKNTKIKKGAFIPEGWRPEPAAATDVAGPSETVKKRRRKKSDSIESSATTAAGDREPQATTEPSDVSH